MMLPGFTNLLDVDVRFGPFTCILGLNGFGKSNLFEAIHFFSLLADRLPMDAAVSMPVVIRLLSDMAMDVATSTSSANPLRQVMVNPHSPTCVA